MSTPPVLYTFRRCPYAIRARMAIAYAGITVELREVLLKNKPTQMLSASRKGTVPVLVLPDGQVIDESLEVMYWALGQSDPRGWLPEHGINRTANKWISENDGPFKAWLDKYKYADRFPEHDASWYRSQAEGFLQALDAQLTGSEWLSGQNIGLLDVAVFPFIRQFAAVDNHWFERSRYRALRAWLALMLENPLFMQVMTKHAPWSAGNTPTLFEPPFER